jgi:C-terminal processing protease CtpA/Prc
MQRDPQKFKELVLSAVNAKYFNEKIHKEVREEFKPPEDIDKIVDKRVNFTDEYDPFDI